MSEKRSSIIKPVSRLKNLYSSVSLRTRLIFWVALGTAFAFLFPILCNVFGSRIGGAIGIAVGSFHAVTEDMPAAYEQGVEDGLSAEDLRVSLEGNIREVGRLNVLAANAKISDMHELGDRYKALYTLGADVFFSVDLTQAVVYEGEKQFIISIPRPEGKINIDSTKTRLEAEWRRLFFNGSTEAGIDAYINSMKKIQNNETSEINDYPLLRKRAEESALKQVRMLSDLFILNGNKEVIIQFAEKAGDNT